MSEALDRSLIVRKTILKKKRVSWIAQDIFRTCNKWKKICIENTYIWRTMDRDLLEEAKRLIDDSSK